VTGSFVPATACDDLTPQLLEAHRQPLADAQVVLAMSCAFGVQNLAATVGKRVVPALDTLFFGLETSPGCYQEVCRQCGQCILGETAGICPVTACHKGLVNGPCGGTNRGKCEIDKEKDCAWTSIYLRLKELGQLELMRKYHQPRNHQVFPKPGKMTMQDGRSDRP
ncbi:MAG: 5,10-methylenetetrahydrofolate reductase, partial [Deltaproteobacteria bacterium]|nr:5,10-methylenetetrahydrofolate reductase [Deltaproteobacteria bacterium]